MNKRSSIFASLNLLLFLCFVTLTAAQSLMQAGKTDSQNRHQTQVQQSHILSGDNVVYEREVENEKEDSHGFKPLCSIKQVLPYEWRAASLNLFSTKSSGLSCNTSRTIFLDLRSLRI